jgi:molecular chaperone GrpE
MNPQDQIQPEESLVELDMDTSPSVDDFIKELEAKEKDLHITSDLTIEVSDSEFDEVPEFIQEDLPQVEKRRPPDTHNGAGLKTRVYELENELAALKEKNAMLRSDRNDIQEKSDRRLKDFESYKYRMDRERRGSFIDQISNLASQMLPVLDNLDRALDSIEKNESERSPEFQQFYEGIILVNQQVNEVFSEMGVQPIATVGEPFDPNFHEAVATEERDDMPANTVSGEMLRGYRIGNRVIRHSMVKVTTNAAAAKKAETAPPAAAPDAGETETEAVDLDPPVDVIE